MPQRRGPTAVDHVGADRGGRTFGSGFRMTPAHVRPLVARLLSSSIEILTDWCSTWERRRDAGHVRGFCSLAENCRRALGWLFDATTQPDKISAAEAFSFFDFDRGRALSKLLNNLDFEAMQILTDPDRFAAAVRICAAAAQRRARQKLIIAAGVEFLTRWQAAHPIARATEPTDSTKPETEKIR